MKKLLLIASLLAALGVLPQAAYAQIPPPGNFQTIYVIGDSRNQGNCINGATDFTTYLKSYLPPNWAAATVLNYGACGQNLETTDFKFTPVPYPQSGWANAVIMILSSVNSALGAASGPGAPPVTPGGDSAATMYAHIQSVASKAALSGEIFVLGIEPAVGSLSPTQLAQYQALQRMILQGPVFWQYLVRLDQVFPTNVDPADYFDATHMYTPTGARKIAQQIGWTISAQTIYQGPYNCGDQCQ